MYLLTRPEQKLTTSVAAFRAAGIAVTGVAPVTICYDQTQIDQCKAQFAKSAPHLAIVTSTFAAVKLYNEGEFGSDTIWMAVGTSTASVLRRNGFTVTVPRQQNSEGLLSLSQLHSANSRRVVIIKGQGGRTTLRDTLLTRGFKVEEYLFYYRKKNLRPIQTDNWQWHAIKGIVATSGEMAEQLFELYDSHSLCERPWLTVSERIAERLKASGVHRVAVCNDASDNALSAWIKDNWE
ncbi:uroporphyrinogen-III synthase [Alteromonas sp. C1M14]|uniref:uroporphyrinogen-III synthase n=1 Tax=Alteromonas sp. C1M14 TaxID=2841567 RepID=UPI001C0A352F|nr:uroporphyrinogen-III synthase [Alteromonas sp. C1M14]MBU2979960.1 uroporphyrinogen-III synthase [Alteromonas sp. C1M14]